MIKLADLEWHEGRPDVLKPGMVVVEGTEPYLIGHANDEASGCACCEIIDRRKIVRWAMLEIESCT